MVHAQGEPDAPCSVEEPLPVGEARDRTLFDSIDVGFCVVEIVLDAAGAPVDYRFEETTPAFERQSGLHRVVGKRMRELAPDHEAHWFDLYGRVAATGEPVRFVQEAKALGEHWFDVSAIRLGGAGDRRIAILFTDIRSRRRPPTTSAPRASAPSSATSATSPPARSWSGRRTSSWPSPPTS